MPTIMMSSQLFHKVQIQPTAYINVLYIYMLCELITPINYQQLD